MWSPSSYSIDVLSVDTFELSVKVLRPFGKLHNLFKPRTPSTVGLQNFYNCLKGFYSIR